MHKDHLKWVPSEFMLADALTNIDRKLRAKLTNFLRKPVIVMKNAAG